MNFARLVFSQSCSWLRSVVPRRLPIIVLMLSLSSATSPRASTWIERVRSPLVTAVATSAIARTWLVRLAASRLTLPVRSCQVPAAGDVGLAAQDDLRRRSRGRAAPRRERVQLVDHRVDCVLELEDLALDVDGDLAREIPLAMAVANVAMLRT